MDDEGVECDYFDENWHYFDHITEQYYEGR